MSQLIEQIREAIVAGELGSVRARRAELATLVQMSGGLRATTGGELTCDINVDSCFSAQRVHAHIDALGRGGVQASTFTRDERAATRWVIGVVGGGAVLARACGLLTRSGQLVRGLPPPAVGGGPVAAAGIWRAALLSTTRVRTHTRQGRVLVVDCPNLLLAVALTGAAHRLGVHAASTRMVRGQHGALIPTTHNIIALLHSLGLDESGHRWERTLATLPRPRTATNQARTITAGAATAARAQRALDILGEHVCPDHREIAERRIADPTAPLAQLGQQGTVTLSDRRRI